jgi:hypothetical protein
MNPSPESPESPETVPSALVRPQSSNIYSYWTGLVPALWTTYGGRKEIVGINTETARHPVTRTPLYEQRELCEF